MPSRIKQRELSLTPYGTRLNLKLHLQHKKKLK